MNFEHLGVDVTRQLLLELDYKELSRFCGSDKFINSICKSETFWREKYYSDFIDSAPSNVKSWSQLYKYKYASTHKQKTYSLVYFSSNNRQNSSESETLITAYAKDKEQFIDFLVAMYNDEDSNEIQNILIPIINRAIPLLNFNALRSESDVVEKLIGEYLHQKPDIVYHEYMGSKPVTSSTLKHILWRFVMQYYLNPGSLQGTRSDSNAIIVFDLFKHLYDQGFFKDSVIDFPSDEQEFAQTVQFNETEESAKYYSDITPEYFNSVLTVLKSNEIDKGVYDGYTISTDEIYVLPAGTPSPATPDYKEQNQ